MDSTPSRDTAETSASGIGTEAPPKDGQGDEAPLRGDGITAAPNGSTENEHARVPAATVAPILLELHTSLLSGEELGSFSMVADSAVLDLKRRLLKLPALQGTAVPSLRLVFGGQALKDRQRLSAAGVPSGARLQAVRCPSQRAEAVLRCRPPIGKPRTEEERPLLSLDAERGLVFLARSDEREEPAELPREFELDGVYGAESTQEELFNGNVRSMVDDVVQGRSGLIICYGQSFSGKRHTVFGDGRWLRGLLADRLLRAPDLEGLLPRSFDCIADCIAATSGATVVVSVSFLEVVQDMAYDLLDGVDGPMRQCRVRRTTEGAPYAEGLSSREVRCVDDMRAALADGWARHVGWVMHMGGSDTTRSHMLFTITVDVHEVSSDGSRSRRSATLRFAKLAGSERPPRTPGALGALSLHEYSAAHPSCAAFMTVVRALARNADPSHRPAVVPWRNSKITHLLKNDLDGSARTLMVATCHPDRDCRETLVTLRVAQEMRKVAGMPRAREDASLQLSEEELASLERLRWVEPAAAGGGRGGGGAPAADA